MSKKIVFVEKDEGTYDPVMAFFNKRHQANIKTNSTIKAPSATKQGDKKNMTAKLPPKDEKNSQIEPKDIQTAKSMKKEAFEAKDVPARKQAVKSRDISSTNVKRESQTGLPKQQSKKLIKQEQKEQKTEMKEDSLQKFPKMETPKGVPKSETSKNMVKNDELTKKVADFQLREQEYIRRIEELEANQEKYVKNEQKLAKLQKDYKAAVQRSKEGEGAVQKLKEKQSQLKEILEGKSIPFSRKREVILSNKLKQLKRINRELVLRLKSYKGTDLVELSMQQNREEIIKDLYTVDVEQQLNEEMNIEMESLVSQLTTNLEKYIERRVKEKGERLPWNEEQTWLMELMALSQKISLSYLEKYQICPLPKTNQEAISAYSLLEQYKQSNQMQAIADRFHLNIALSKQNADILAQLDQLDQQSQSVRAETVRLRRKKEENKGKLNQYIQLLERQSSFKQILLIQSICQLEMMKEWIEKVHGRVNQQLKTISAALSEIGDIVAVGDSAKESLYFYLSNNIGALSCKFPALNYSFKQIKLDFKQLTKQDSYKQTK